VIELFKQDGFNYFLEEWSRLDMLRGKQVVVHPSGIEGKVVGVNLQGALTIKDDKTEHVINAGEVSVRKK
jgi:biotin-(acetyl-CoA carboxylase) ligase